MKRVVVFFAFILLVCAIWIFNQKVQISNVVPSPVKDDQSLDDLVEVEKDRLFPPFSEPKESLISLISDTITLEWNDQNNRVQIFTQSLNKENNTFKINQLTFEENADATDAIWSPNMQKIAFFVSSIEKGGRIYDLYIMNSDGSNKTLLVGGLDDGQLVSWSPDNQKILMVLPLDRNNSLAGNGIYELSVDGTHKDLLYSGGYILYNSPKYSPDGNKIIFSRDSNKLEDSVYLYDVYLLDIQTHHTQRLTDNKSTYTNTSDYLTTVQKR